MANKNNGMFIMIMVMAILIVAVFVISIINTVNFNKCTASASGTSVESAGASLNELIIPQGKMLRIYTMSWCACGSQGGTDCTASNGDCTGTCASGQCTKYSIRGEMK
jgi:hypothetical protein